MTDPECTANVNKRDGCDLVVEFGRHRSDQDTAETKQGLDVHGVAQPFSISYDRKTGGADGTSIAPALDTAASVIILALPLPSEAVSGPKSLNRMTAVPTTATNAATSMGTFL